jgi:hypothetical protein
MIIDDLLDLPLPDEGRDGALLDLIHKIIVVPGELATDSQVIEGVAKVIHRWRQL